MRAIRSVLDTAHTATYTYMLYWYLIKNFANVENLDIDTWSNKLQLTLTASVVSMVQLFYARRLYLMSHNIALVVIIVVLSALVFAMGFVFPIRQSMLKSYFRDSTLIWVSSVGFGSGASADILIALSMCWCLYRNRTGFARTDSMIKTLMIYIISTGTLTSVLASATLISFAISPTTLIAQAVYGPLGSCYVNSLLAMLNNRKLIRDKYIADTSETSHNTMTRPASISVSVNVHPGQAATMSVDFRRSKHDLETSATALEFDTSMSSAHKELSESTV
ncbi:hypothetical protein BJV74DRAFT_890465 [Russula compacta]|nr:hypothetical protein BJV74DRAFT_890465 [Russula compacta]